jgi:predicted nucleotidyltransferase
MPADGMIFDQLASPIDELAQRLGTSWTRIAAARAAARRKTEELNLALSLATSPDASVVVYGSLAREELTQGSDLDWTLLVDGQADLQHQKELLSVREKLKDLGKGPGRERTFGKLTFSHPLLHLIGGEDDTNANTTRRVLFLLEAVPIGRYKQAFHRVRKHILHRYLTDDHGLKRKATVGDTRWVPLFLLNDMARYWRTMTVDFAYKQWDRGNEGYALRSLKLGTSRKLIYASGLLSCFWCDPAVSKGDYDPVNLAEKLWTLNQKLSEMLYLTPLERFARFFLTHAEDQFLLSSANRLFKTYDEFLGLLENNAMRDHLEHLPPEAMDEDADFQAARSIRTRFEEDVKMVFLDPQSRLYRLTISRGVF